MFVLESGQKDETQAIEYYEDFKIRQEERKKLTMGGSISIKTMIRGLDKVFTGGGLMSGDLFLVVGVTSTGKTYFTSSQIGLMAITQGWSGIHITLEDTVWSIGNRYDARLFKVEKEKLAVHDLSVDDLKYMDAVLKRHRKLAGKLQIVGMPGAACRVETIKRIISERRMAGYKVDFLIIDSPDHMPPIRKREQHRFEIKDLFQALKDLATEYWIPVIATTQMPAKFEGKIATQKAVTAESIDKMRIASKAITLNHTDDMLPDEIMIVLVKNRDGKDDVRVSVITDLDKGVYRELKKPEDEE